MLNRKFPVCRLMEGLGFETTAASSRNPRQRAELQFAATAPLVSRLAPGASTNQTQPVSRSQDSWWL